MKGSTAVVVLSGVAFVSYGVHCLVSPSMRAEFERFGLAHMRLLTGALEITAGVGLIVGLWWPLVLRLASGGLVLLMVCALAARWRAGDPLWSVTPALALLLVNAAIFYRSMR